jgi:hypothetical protein
LALSSLIDRHLHWYDVYARFETCYARWLRRFQPDCAFQHERTAARRHAAFFMSRISCDAATPPLFSRHAITPTFSTLMPLFRHSFSFGYQPLLFTPPLLSFISIHTLPEAIFSH